MKIYNFKQNTDDWTKVRLGKLTASSAQAISTNGKGLETLAFEKVAEIMTGKAKEHYINADMERGNEFEAMARNSYELESGNIVKEIGFVEMDEFVGCSPDGFIGKNGLVEIKCKNDPNFVRYLYNKKIDANHIWQMQMQMYVTKRKWCDYVIFNENFPTTTVITRVKIDPESQKKIIIGIASGVARIKEILTKVGK